jgi:DNA-binding transcriptional LysR family regulator
MKNITLRQLRVFSAAARLLNFGKAAQEMHLTPPAVSIQIR